MSRMLLDPLSTRRLTVQALFNALTIDRFPTNTKLTEYLYQRDALIGGCGRQRDREVTRGQILDDLQRWLDDPHHQTSP